MEIKRKPKHVIDFIFPISLFFVFAVSSLVVLLLAANLYQSSVKESKDQDTSITILSYISEKIHQKDANGNVSIDTIDGIPCLFIQETFDDATYHTYIYQHNGFLKELYLKDKTVPSLNAGKEIMELKSIEMKELTNSLFSFSVTTKDGTTNNIITGIKSRPTKQ